MTKAALGWSEALNRQVRTGTPASLAVSTYSKIQESVSSGDSAAAGPMVDFFVTEARVIFEIYTAWRQNIRRYLDSELPPDIVEAKIARIEQLVSEYHPDLHHSRDTAWEAVIEAAEELKTRVADAEKTVRSLEKLRHSWRILHDADVDFLSGLMDIVVRELGESALGTMYEEWVLGDWFKERYSQFDVSENSWEHAFELLVYLTFEAMHGHLCGPDRDGSMTYEAFDDRVTVTFTPCGSGGRTVAGEPLDQLDPLMEPPFRYRVTQEENPFAWNKRGICAYCAHCCVILEKLPIEKFGYPVRVVEPPTYPNDGSTACSWTMYRKIEDVPEWVYERVGATKPAPGSPLGSAGFKGASGRDKG